MSLANGKIASKDIASPSGMVTPHGESWQKSFKVPGLREATRKVAEKAGANDDSLLLAQWLPLEARLCECHAYTANSAASKQADV